jgi:hypothetical protein
MAEDGFVRNNGVDGDLAARVRGRKRKKRKNIPDLISIACFCCYWRYDEAM